MSRRTSFTDRRRRQLAVRVAGLERMEGRNLALGLTALGGALPGAAAALAARPIELKLTPPRPPDPPAAGQPRAAAVPQRPAPTPMPAELVVVTPPKAPTTDWLDFVGGGGAAASDSGAFAATFTPAPPLGGGGGAMAGSAGGGAVIMPLRIPPPAPPIASAASGSSSTLLVAGAGLPASGGAATAAVAAPTPAHAAASGGALPTAPAPAGGSGTRTAPGGSGGSGGGSGGASAVDPGLLPPTDGPTGPALDSFPYFQLYTLDYNQGVVLFPTMYQLANFSQKGDLRAQVAGSSGYSFSWSLDTNMTDDTSGVAGKTTNDLTFSWGTEITQANNASVTLTVTDANSHQEQQTYWFHVPQGGSSISGGGGNTTWPTALAPDTVQAASPATAVPHGDVTADAGAFETAVALPAYSPVVPGLSLSYSSTAADPRPIVDVPYALQSSPSSGTQLTAQLTFNGTSGGTSYYGIGGWVQGDIAQVALQADATTLSTGRYGYSAALVEAGTYHTTITGTATVLSPTDSHSPSSYLGQGWSLDGLERIVTNTTGGVVLDTGAGDSLWFASAGSGGGGYTSPAGEFSTLASVSGGGWTRTLTNGTVYTFNSSGLETKVTDRDARVTSYGYSGSELTTITDPYGKVTTLTYSGGYLQAIEDPAARYTTFTHSGATLTGVETPDTARVTYAYDGSGRMTTLTDQNGNTTKVAFDSAERVGTVIRADSTTQLFVGSQEQGFVTGTSSSSPGTPTLLAAAAGSATDPNSHTSTFHPDWNGLGTAGQTVDPDGNVTTYDRNSNGLATVAIDRLNRISQYGYDGHGNVTKVTFPDLNSESYTYNGDAQVTVFTDANGHTTTYVYSSDGHSDLVNVDRPAPGFGEATPVTTMTYNSTGRVTSVTDPNNHTTSFGYDSQDRLVTTTYPAVGGSSAVTTIVYDSYGNVGTAIDARGNATTYSHDLMGRVTGKTDPLNDLTTLTYDSGGDLTVDQEPTPAGQTARTTTYAYDSLERLTTLTAPLNATSTAVTVYGRDSGGNVTKITDPLGRVTTIQYDAEDRPTVEITPLTGSTTRTVTTSYDAEGQTLTVTEPALSGGSNRVTSYSYDSRGWVETMIDPFGNTSTYTYTATGKPATESNPSGGGSGSGGSGDLASYTYDALDRQVAFEDADGNVTTTLYDAAGNQTTLTDANNHSTVYAYDARNRLTTITDALGHATVYGYDSNDNRITVTDGNTLTTTTQYDALNRATTVTDARGAVTVLSFDSGGRNTVVKDPDGNLTTFAFDAGDRRTTMTTPTATGGTASATYAYDSGGELVDTTDRDGRRVTYSYDSGGRQTGQTWYDNAGHVLNTVTSTYDADGQLTGASDSYATLTFTYDSGGRMASAVTLGAGSTQPLVTLTYGYDAFGNRTSMSDSLSGTGGKGQGLTTYIYDAAFRLTTLTQSFGGTNGPQVVLGYDSGGNLTSQSRTVGGSGTAVTSALTYDAANRLGTIVDKYGTTGLATFVYGYDSGGRVTTEVDTEVAGGTTYTYNATYSYDSSDELTTVTALRSGSAANEAYGYDSGGNRNTTGYTTGGDNALTASPTATYTYDAEGNMTGQTDTSTHNVWIYSYDDRNRLTGVVEKNSGGTTLNQATYTYDALDRRIGIQDNSGGTSTTTWTVFDGTEPYADFSGSTTSTVTERYLAAPGVLGAPLARTDSGGNSAWYLTDHLGSVHDVVNPSGSVVDHVAYDSYGNIAGETNPAGGDHFKYAGMIWDVAIGQYLAEHRPDDPLTGRFDGQDPKGFGGGSTDLYVYAGNAPTDATDPSGLSPQDSKQDKQRDQQRIDITQETPQLSASDVVDMLQESARNLTAIKRLKAQQDAEMKKIRGVQLQDAIKAGDNEIGMEISGAKRHKADIAPELKFMVDVNKLIQARADAQTKKHINDIKVQIQDQIRRYNQQMDAVYHYIKTHCQIITLPASTEPDNPPSSIVA